MQELLERNEQRERASTLATAIAGAAAGAVGTVALDSVDWFLWNREDPSSKRRTEEVRPGGEPPADVLVGRIEEAAGAQPSERTHHRRGVAMHVAIGIAPAIGYALARDRLPVKGMGAGALFGLGLWLLQDEVLNSLTGLGAKPQDYLSSLAEMPVGRCASMRSMTIRSLSRPLCKAHSFMMVEKVLRQPCAHGGRAIPPVSRSS
jgi:hypothetical protein